MDKLSIIDVKAYETYSDSGFPAVEVHVATQGDALGIARCSESYSTSSHRPKYLYDGGTRFRGFGVTKAADLINRVFAPALIGMRADDQASVDAVIFRTALENGAEQYVNVTNPLSIAVLQAGAQATGQPLYRHVGGQTAFTLPVCGHLCASGSKRYTEDNQAQGRPNYMIVAYDFPTLSEAQYALWEVANQYEKIIAHQFGFVIHRGFAMAIPKGKIENDYVLWDALTQSINMCGYEGKLGIHVDIGANEYYNHKTGMYEGLFSSEPKTRDELIALIEKMASDYPFVIIQDPLEENDTEGFARLVKTTGVQIVGSDICGTDFTRIEECIRRKWINSVQLSVNQFPTFSDAVKVVRMVKNHGADIMIRDLCGEGYDGASYAIGFKAGTIYECGLDSNGNMLMMNAEEIGPRAKFYGKSGIQGEKFSL
jgi:enolase